MRSSTSPGRVLGPALVTLALCTGSACSSGDGAPAGPDLAAAVARQDPEPPAAAPAALSPVPAPGTVSMTPGPFTDRVVLADLSLADGQVSGTLDVVSDVSDLLALEVRVDAYDAGGTLLGTARQVVLPEQAEAYHSTAGVQDLPIAVPAAGAASAVVSIPVLVNE